MIAINSQPIAYTDFNTTNIIKILPMAALGFHLIVGFS